MRAVHEDYIRAGAQVITTNTYVAILSRFEREGIGDRYHELNRLAGELAGQARDNCGRDVLIAGSLPPLNGSYRPDRVRPIEEIEPLYRDQAQILAPYVDLFLCETMSTGAEAVAAARGAAVTASSAPGNH